MQMKEYNKELHTRMEEKKNLLKNNLGTGMSQKNEWKCLREKKKGRKNENEPVKIEKIKEERRGKWMKTIRNY